jgi:hypothetical protein
MALALAFDFDRQGDRFFKVTIFWLALNWTFCRGAVTDSSVSASSPVRRQPPYNRLA